MHANSQIAFLLQQSKPFHPWGDHQPTWAKLQASRTITETTKFRYYLGEEADIIGLECNDLLAGDNADDGLNAEGEDINWRVRLSASLLEAVEDTMRYCAIHFLIHPFA